MPIIYQDESDSHQLLVWKITESLDFFAKELQLNKYEKEELGNITNTSRMLEWTATRYVQRILLPIGLKKDHWGKPHLEGENGFISIAHCKGYAAVVYSASQSVGIDIEPVHDKVQRIASKFLNEKELIDIAHEDKSEYFTRCWSIKEAVYKWYGKKQLSFKNNINILNFNREEKIAGVLFTKDTVTHLHQVKCEKIDNIILTYTTEF
mgnify:CR=1 FL=1|tara:strand:+ start:3931 stop:4554 length:624 start_codon:yes stop_codon:yes gene_type:complete